MSNSIPVYLVQESLPQGYHESSILAPYQGGFAIYIEPTADTDATLRRIQQAGRKLDNLGLVDVAVAGDMWAIEQEWALYRGFVNTLNTNTVTFSSASAHQLNQQQAAYQWVRELVNLPPNELFPERLAQKIADKLTEVGGQAISYRLVKGDELLKENRMGLHTVGRASVNPPVLLELDYNPTGQADAAIDYALVGKGITFDTGGYSIKTSEGMLTMKCDMGGAATVAGALFLAIQQGLKKRVTLLLCCAENMIGSRGYKNGDVITYSNGTRVEVVNTDAEGRLVLADGLLRAGELQAKQVIDAATLTGAAQVAVGKQYNALFSLDETFAQQALTVAGQVHENLWRLPLSSWHQYECPSAFADTANSVPQKGGGSGGASNAAGFLLRFAPHQGQGWLHFDLAAAYHGQADKYFAAGATATGVRTIAQLLLQP